jgi:hypothetical protein
MLEGGCLCGAVRYRIGVTPQSSIVCHCATCRRASGATPVGWITVARSEFKIAAGSPRTYSSSPGVIRQFCGHCGTALTYLAQTSAQSIDITTATLDDPNAFPPTAEVWLADKLSWQPTAPATAKFKGSSSD